MSKITFRADDELIDELETFDASKSEVMRDALRTYLEAGETSQTHDSITQAEPARTDAAHENDSIDELIRERVDTLLEDRLTEHRHRETQDVNVTVALENAHQTRKTPNAVEDEPVADHTEPPRPTREANHGGHPSGDQQCGQCGESLSGEHVYCPNCGEKASHRLFCECGDELRSDWAFCPGCGRRTAAADVLDSNSQHSRNS
ncbi:CopG family transcriptional regulator [Halostagnicola sp. A-GB9-2]|uniref:double zinc ribbon domain-containing protein n=1 Tax=Halostagnicola sp. A-GB9-2 TaxID=3048066 RepID=UPI0024BF95C3|nr:CopG family transcriptional regulator [Halostagnicola sp. A-GB9-2]MDJ1433908.1 CopG family transcriptional regulator [Halostagnicola sp. A-GB9-2]